MVLVLLFIVVPIAELYVIVQASHAIGFLNTLGLIILIALVGSWLIKREGLKVWTRFTGQVQAGKVPTQEIADGVCLLGAGALMLTPGFLTDAVALLLLFPPTRVVARKWLMRRKGFVGTGKINVITANYGRRGRSATNVTDATSTDATSTDATSTEVKGQLGETDL
jgi:UPF0716 protein FxsA